MNELDIQGNRLLQILEGHYQKVLNKEDLLEIWKKKAWNHFLGLDFSKNKYLAHLNKIEYQLPREEETSINELKNIIFPESQGSYILFVNGFFNKELSNIEEVKDKIEIFDLQEAMKHHPIFMQKMTLDSVKFEHESFSLLNAALQIKGLYVHVLPNCKIEKPIQIIHIITKEAKDLVISPRIEIFLNKKSSATIYFTIKDDQENKNLWINQVVDFHLQEESICEYIQPILMKGKSIFFDCIRADLHKESRLNIISIVKNSNLIKHDYKINLVEPLAACKIKGICMLEKENSCDMYLKVNHHAKETHFSQLYKTVLKDSAKAFFQADVKIRFDAIKSSSDVQNRNLLLSDDVKVISQPNMQIFADDVKATHGSTIQQIEKDKLFYLLSRGLDKDFAKSLLISSFKKEIIDLIEIESIKKELEESDGF